MKTTIISAVLTVSLLLTGCGKKSGPRSSTASAAPPLAQPCMTAWQQGDESTAISRFVRADWSTLPLFAANSALSLNEEEFQALSNAERKTRSREIMSQLDVFKKLAAAVAQAGRDTASKGDTAQAQKYFTSLKRCGMALDQPGCLRLRVLQLEGEALEQVADAELAKIGQ